MSGHAFLDEHRATLVPDGSGLALRYPVASYEYGSRLEESVDCEIPIGARDYDVALLIAKVLREHVAPAAPWVDPPPAEMSFGIQWGKKSQVSYT